MLLLDMITVMRKYEAVLQDGKEGVAKLVN